MSSKRFFAFSLMFILSVVVSTLVTTRFLGQSADSATLELMQAPGAVAVADNQVTLNNRDYEDIDGMVLQTPRLAGGDLIITFSAEHFPAITSSATSVIIRCMVDGEQAEPGDLTLGNYLLGLRASAETTNSTLVFVVSNISPGAHQVVVQGRRAGLTGGETLRERTLTVVNVR
jgi:hypothetical protein